jgi:hypothetical protein
MPEEDKPGGSVWKRWGRLLFIGLVGAGFGLVMGYLVVLIERYILKGTNGGEGLPKETQKVSEKPKPGPNAKPDRAPVTVAAVVGVISAVVVIAIVIWFRRQFFTSARLSEIVGDSRATVAEIGGVQHARSRFKFGKWFKKKAVGPVIRPVEKDPRKGHLKSRL